MKLLPIDEILLFLPQIIVGGFVGGFNNRFQFFTVIGCHSLSFRLVNDSTPSVQIKINLNLTDLYKHFFGRFLLKLIYFL